MSEKSKEIDELQAKISELKNDLEKQNDQHKIELDENKSILTEVNEQMNDLLQTVDMKEGLSVKK